jgi:hypothetical protein
MAAHAESADRVFLRGAVSGGGDALAVGRGQSAAELWRAQRELGMGRAAGSDWVGLDF